MSNPKEPASPKKAVGPYRLDEQVASAIVESLRMGSSHAGAAGHAGIALSTLKVWFKKGRDGEEPYAALWARVEVARNAWETVALAKIHKAADAGTWTAAAWLLERRLPKLYARQRDDERIVRAAEVLMEKRIAEARADLARETLETAEAVPAS